MAWLLAHDKITVPTAEPTGTLVLSAGARGTRRFRLDEPHLETAADVGGEDRVAAWFTDTDAEEVTTFTTSATGAAAHSLTVPGRTPLAVPGGVQIADRFTTASGSQYLTLAWPAGPRGAAAASGGGVVRHGVPDAGPGLECVCRERGCGGLVPGARHLGSPGVGVAPRRGPPMRGAGRATAVRGGGRARLLMPVRPAVPWSPASGGSNLVRADRSARGGCWRVRCPSARARLDAQCRVSAGLAGSDGEVFVLVRGSDVAVWCVVGGGVPARAAVGVA
ncbi:hypothetical protein [Streptomyces sp. NPDC089919]|uniref:hypothetical protein n=1 Tax=Streptomyces sp. NPDC089919 TaxID=3155188 RepID=UPI003432EF8D